MKTAELKIDIKINTNVTRFMVSSIPYLGAMFNKITKNKNDMRNEWFIKVKVVISYTFRNY